MIAVLLLAVVLAAIVWFVRPPGPGEVYRSRSDQYGLPGSTALLLRNGDCLVLSREEADIGRAEAAPGSEGRLYVIAGTERIRSGRDEAGLYLADTRTGLLARPGDAIDAGIIWRQDAGGLDHALAAGWPVDTSCGRGLATIHAMDRVHR